MALLGVALLWVTFGGVGYALGWQSHLTSGGSALVGRERGVIRAVAQRHTVCIAEPAQTGQLAGILQIPALHLVAPV